MAPDTSRGIRSAQLGLVVNAGLALHDAHILGGKVKSAIRAAVPRVQSVLVHMEPYHEPMPASAASRPSEARAATTIEERRSS